MRYLNLLFFLFLTTFAYGQVNISGKVVNAISNIPVAGATVYINNTSIGTTTDENGEFHISSTLNGSFDLVVSHVSFQTKTTHINLHENSSKLLVVLDGKSLDLNEVTITDHSLKSWKKWRKLFTEYFIGSMEFSRKCTIQNPEVLKFHYNKTDRVLEVTSTSSLLVENRALGYLIKIDLNNFNYSFKTLEVSSHVATFFRDISPADPAEQKSFIANRRYAFNGSKMHFIQSLYQKDYPGQGFSVLTIRLQKNREKLRLQKMISEAMAKAYQENKSSNTVTLAAISNNNRDSVAVYEQILAQPDYVLRDTTTKDIRDSLKFDSKNQFARLHLPDTLMIQYQENHSAKPAVFELPVKNANFTISDKQHSFYKKKVQGQMQYSILFLTPEKTITIYPNGAYDGDEIFTQGFMANGKMSYLLPWDYKAGEN